MNIQHYIVFYFNDAVGEIIVVGDVDGDAGHIWRVPTQIPVTYRLGYLARTRGGTCCRIGNDGTVV